VGIPIDALEAVPQLTTAERVASREPGELSRA
jgi:hypothetical protein